MLWTLKWLRVTWL